MSGVYPPAQDDQAIVRAMTDRWRLARLVRLGRASRHDGPYELRHPEVAKRFVADIQRRVVAQGAPGVNLAIRPRNKRRRR